LRLRSSSPASIPSPMLRVVVHLMLSRKSISLTASVLFAICMQGYPAVDLPLVDPYGAPVSAQKLKSKTPKIFLARARHIVHIDGNPIEGLKMVGKKAASVATSALNGVATAVEVVGNAGLSASKWVGKKALFGGRVAPGLVDRVYNGMRHQATRMDKNQEAMLKAVVAVIHRLGPSIDQALIETGIRLIMKQSLLPTSKWVALRNGVAKGAVQAVTEAGPLYMGLGYLSPAAGTAALTLSGIRAMATMAETAQGRNLGDSTPIVAKRAEEAQWIVDALNEVDRETVSAANEYWTHLENDLIKLFSDMTGTHCSRVLEALGKDEQSSTVKMWWMITIQAARQIVAHNSALVPADEEVREMVRRFVSEDVDGLQFAISAMRERSGLATKGSATQV
jgi:hypothetical protein